MNMRIDTDRFLTLGMALTSDRRVMERRVRGVFARKRSAKGAVALSLLLVLALGFAAFTTACQPGTGEASGADEALVSSGDTARGSDGNAQVATDDGDMRSAAEDAAAAADASAASADTAASEGGVTKALQMKRMARILSIARNYPAPRMESVVSTELGSWSTMQNPDDAQRLTAADRFLETANALFETTYTPNDLIAVYYVDQTGYRADVWRFDSTDGVLSGALEAESLAFLSADCLNEPGDGLHASLANLTDGVRTWERRELFDPGEAAERAAQILQGAVAGGLQDRGGSGQDGARVGWLIRQSILFPLGDGRYCAMSVFADEALTPTTVCVYPDADCAEEGVYWRADLQRTQNAARLLHPQDFRAGSPGSEDMPKEEAYAFFYRLVDAAGYEDSAGNEMPKEPKATFYADHSGARENYWHIVDGGVSLDLTSKTGQILSLSVNGSLGGKLGLTGIAYEEMGESAYEGATQAFFAALLGEDAVASVFVNAVYDEHYCTMDAVTADGTIYEILYRDGLITEIARFVQADPNTWQSVPTWLAGRVTQSSAGEGFSIQGLENSAGKIVPNWLADWVYLNAETSEIFLQEW